MVRELSLSVEDVAVTTRPMTSADGPAVMAFARELPEHDLLFLPHDITQVSHLNAWLRDLESGATKTTLALSGDRIIAYASVSRNQASWSRHVAEISVVVGQGFRSKGLGRALCVEAFRTALDGGAEKMLAQMTTDQDAARRLFRRLGFRSEAVLQDHVKDPAGNLHDLVVMSHATADFASTLGLVHDGQGYRAAAVPPPTSEDD